MYALRILKNWYRKRAAEIVVREASLQINGYELFPNGTIASLEMALGKPTRKWVSEVAGNTIYTWDSAGLTALENADTSKLVDVSGYFAERGYPFSPRSRFSGVLIINGVEIKRSSRLSSIPVATGSCIRTDDNQYSHDTCASFVFGAIGPGFSFDFAPSVVEFSVSLSSE